MTQAHQLAAILFADVVGYSAIMQEDESEAMEKLRLFKEILESEAVNHNGKVIQYYGDGSLLLFNSSVDAVLLAKTVQERFAELPLRVRIGIHMGDVLLKDNNVFGDAVNIASRIQALAPPGKIRISEPVFKNIINKKNINTEFVKEEFLKNIKDPIRIYEVKSAVPKTLPRVSRKKKGAVVLMTLITFVILAGIYFIYTNSNKNKKTNPISLNESLAASIAVLPFDDNSPGKDQEYLGDGIAEEILNVLGQMKDLKVTGRSSSFFFKGTETDLQTIGIKLGVKTILKGSIQKFDDLIRIYIQLFNTEDGYLIWSEKYERKLKNIYSIQDEIASKICEKLKITLLNKSDSTGLRSVNPDAVETVLKGNYFFNKGEFSKAIDNYTRAIGIDSMYAYPYIRMGWAIYQLTLYNVFTSKEGFSKAKSFIQKGLALNPSSTERQSAHHILAYINLWQFDWKNAQAEYEELKKIDPDHSSMYAFYQSFLYGKTFEAVSILKAMASENPFDILTLRDLSVTQYLDKQYDEALKTCEKIIDLDSSFSEAYRLKGTIYLIQKKFDLALYNLKTSENKGNPWAFAFKIITLSKMGQIDDAKKLILEMDTPETKHPPSIAKGLIYYSLGEKDKAFKWLNRSYDEGDFWLVSLKVDPIWKPMHSESRFKALVTKMNFP